LRFPLNEKQTESVHAISGSMEGLVCDLPARWIEAKLRARVRFPVDTWKASPRDLADFLPEATRRLQVIFARDRGAFT
jgi:hypothetical protein